MSRYAATHVKPQGAGDARPTALRIIVDEDLVGKLTDKVFFITGCSDGIGVETVRAIHATGATIYAAGRNEKKTKAAIDKIYASDPDNKAPIHFIKVELDCLASVREAAEEFMNKSDKLNVLINNAGVMAIPEARTVDGFESQFAICHLGHFLLFQLLKSVLLSASTPAFPSRVVSLSSIGHRHGPVRFDDINFEKVPYDPWMAYGQAKTANIYFANEVERRYGSKGLHATSLHPGGILTNLASHFPEEERAGFVNDPKWIMYRKSPEQGAATTVYAAISKEWADKGGKYLSNCVEQPAHVPEEADAPPRHPTEEGDGYAPWAYDEAAEGRLWKESLKMVGLTDDD